MDLEVVGRHALLFDDDATAAFINSGDALVDWQSLLIDRYDVRHLLPVPPPPRKRRQQTHSPSAGSSSDAELDHERYLDLPPATAEDELDAGAKSIATGGYHSVAFSYGNVVDSSGQKHNYPDGVGDAGFRPNFPIPESLLQCLPPTVKVHQIIARTASFVAQHGGQSEIVLRVKQGDNPTFGFLMPDHHLHPYFRFLINHQDLLKSDADGNFESEKKYESTSGALSLLGSVYGSGDDDDVAVKDVSESKENESGKTLDTCVSSVGRGSQESVNADTFSKHLSSYKEKVQILNKNPLVRIPKAGIANGKKKEGHSISLPSSSVDKQSSSALSNLSKVEPVISEPPSDLKRLVDKVVEFILKNGKQFEAVLTEQDNKYGRFPFLLPSNQFYPYYVNVLQKAQESKLAGKSFLSEKDSLVVPRQDMKPSLAKERDSSPMWPAIGDIPYDYDRKEKFKMVLGNKSKKDGDDSSSRTAMSPFGVTIDAAQTAAILQAATRGMKNPNLGILSDTTVNRKDRSISLAANEADSTECHMSKEQKLKAERLKRAKLFVAMLKDGAAPVKSELPRSLSVEPEETMVLGKEREGSSVPLDVEISERKDEPEKRHSERKYRSRSTRYEEDEEEKEKNDERPRKKHRSHLSSRENGPGEEDEEVMEHRHGKRKHRSHRSSHKDDEEEDADRRNHKRARKKHRSHRCSDEEDEKDDYEGGKHDKHSKRKHQSHRSSRDKHKHKDRHSRRRRKHEKSSDDEDRPNSSSEKRMKISRSEEELEEGEISSKISGRPRGSVGDGASREASLDHSSLYGDARAPSRPSEATEVSDDLRAKIRAMLMENY